MVMAMYDMIAAATYQDSGFLTPMYHIASVFTSPTTMTESMQDAMGGDTFHVSGGAAVLGATIHMTVGAMYGAVLGLLVTLRRVSGAVLVAIGVVYGVAVFAVSSWIGLPLAAAIFSSGDQISDMASMVGYPTFLTEHLIYGLVAGLLLLAARPRTD